MDLGSRGGPDGETSELSSSFMRDPESDAVSAEDNDKDGFVEFSARLELCKCLTILLANKSEGNSDRLIDQGKIRRD